MRGDRRLFDAEGREVFITMICCQCHKAQPFSAFGIRTMSDGKRRSIPWCTACRGRTLGRLLSAVERVKRGASSRPRREGGET